MQRNAVARHPSRRSSIGAATRRCHKRNNIQNAPPRRATLLGGATWAWQAYLIATLTYIEFRPLGRLDKPGHAGAPDWSISCQWCPSRRPCFPFPFSSTDGAERGSRNPGTLLSYFWAVNIGLGSLPLQAHGIARIREARHGLAIWINCKAPHPNRVNDLAFQPLAHDSGDPIEQLYGSMLNTDIGLGAARPGRDPSMYKDGACFSNPVLNPVMMPIQILST